MHGCLISRHNSSLIWLKSKQWHPVFCVCQGGTFSFPSSRHWAVFLLQWGWAYEGWGDQCPEGSLPEGRRIAEPDAETDSVVFLSSSKAAGDPSFRFPWQPPSRRHDGPSAPRAAQTRAQMASSLSLTWKNGPVSPGFITVCLGTFFFLVFNAHTQHHRGKF